jgi:hypothetical protein
MEIRLGRLSVVDFVGKSEVVFVTVICLLEMLKRVDLRAKLIVYKRG